MIIEITYKGLGKPDTWYGHDDVHKGRTIRGANDIVISDNNVLIRIGKHEEVKENLSDIETIRIIET